MKLRWPLVLMYVLIIAAQLTLLVMGHDWYPDLVARVAAARDGAADLGWTVLMSLVIVSPALLLVAPYAIARSVWLVLQSQPWRLTA